MKKTSGPVRRAWWMTMCLSGALAMSAAGCDDGGSSADNDEQDAAPMGGEGGSPSGGAGGEPMGGAPVGGEPVGGEPVGGEGGQMGGAGGEPMGGAGGALEPCEPQGESVEIIDAVATLSGGESDEMTVELPEDVVGITVLILGEESNIYSMLQFSGPEGQIFISERPPGYTPSQTDQFLSPWPGTFFSPNRATPGEVVGSTLIPNNPELLLTGGAWQYRVAGANAQGRPIDGDVPVQLLVKRAPALPTCGRLNMHFYFTGSKGWTAETAADNEEFQAAFQRMAAFYAPLGIEVVAATFDDIDGGYAVVDGIQGANNELHQLFSESKYDDGVNLFFVERIGGMFGGGIGGISGGVPGPNLTPGTSRSGVVVTTDLDPDPQAIGHIMGHETGHFLGLFHTTELFFAGVNDPIPDTPEGRASDTNLMFPTVTSGEASMTADQGSVLHGNPTLFSGEE